VHAPISLRSVLPRPAVESATIGERYCTGQRSSIKKTETKVKTTPLPASSAGKVE
jgi:hypothetical protein